MSIAASGDGLSTSVDEDSAGLPPSGVVATAELEPELTAVLARAAVSIRMEVNAPPALSAHGCLIGSRCGARLTTAFYSGSFLPGCAWGSDVVVDGPFYGRKQLISFLRPHYPRWRGS